MIVEVKKIEVGAWYWVEWTTEAHRAQVLAADETRIVMRTPWTCRSTWIFSPQEIIGPADPPPASVSWWKRLFRKSK